MDETPRNPHTPGERPLAPGERIEHHEITHRSPAEQAPAPRRGTPMWLFVVPLVILALVLVWYVLTRGEPTSPIEAIENIEFQAPAVDGSP